MRRRRGAQTSRRISKAGDAQTCTRFVVFYGRDGRDASTRSVKLRALHWEATVVTGAWIGAYFVELFCWATAPVENFYKASVH